METLNLFGQILTGREMLLSHFRAARSMDDLAPLVRLEDNFTGVYESGDSVWIVSSLYSMNAYFYATSKDGFLHSDTIYGITRKGNVDLSWNFQAIADLLGLAHVVGEDTLVRGVKSVPMGTVLHWNGKKLERKSFSHQELLSPSAEDFSPKHLIDLFLNGLKAGIGREPILTASSGLDSRVNLAGLLHLGLRPELLVIGQEQSKDVQIVKVLGKAFELQVNHVTSSASDYLDNALQICRVTNGVKPLNHWHSYILGAKAGYGKETHIVTGTNGEHVRAMGFDYGILAMALDRISAFDRQVVTGPVLGKFWQMKTQILLTSDEAAECHPDFAQYYGSPLQNRRFLSLMPAASFVWRSDTFVLEQRRKGFQSCGLKLYSENFWPFSPFLRKSWIDAGWKADLRWRLGSRWHRYAVGQLCPELLAFPEEKEAFRMLPRQRPLYWLGGVSEKLAGIKTQRVVPYVDYHSLMQRRDIVDLLHDHAQELEDFMPKRLLDEIMASQVRDGSRGALFATLAGMAVWKASLR